MGIGPTQERSDNEIISESLTNPSAFSQLFERYVRDISRYITRRSNLDIAEDLVADTFVAAFQSRGSFNGAVSNARPWLYGIAVNVLRHYNRDEGRRARFLRERRHRLAFDRGGSDWDSPSDNPNDCVDLYRFRPNIEAALLQIDADALEPLLLLAYAELTYEEIAYTLGIPLGTVRSRISRSRKKLRKLLEPLETYLKDDQSPVQISQSPEENYHG